MGESMFSPIADLIIQEISSVVSARDEESCMSRGEIAAMLTSTQGRVAMTNPRLCCSPDALVCAVDGDLVLP